MTKIEEKILDAIYVFIEEERLVCDNISWFESLNRLEGRLNDAVMGAFLAANNDPVLSRTCTICGKPFNITVGELDWLEKKGLKPFRKCQQCRDYLKKQRNQAVGNARSGIIDIREVAVGE